MSNLLGYSSELYCIDPQDIACLPNTPSPHPQPPRNEIIILLEPNGYDTLLCGREQVMLATEQNLPYVSARIAFKTTIPWWNIAAIFIKPLRQKYKYQSSNIYHTSLPSLRALQIERGIRNAENAYQISKRWHISDEERTNRYTKLTASLKKGFDDNYPLSVMLCRRIGIKDCVDDGHHRIGICSENNIERVALRFRAAGTLALWVQKLFARFI